jgi:hypothetical protein
MAKSAMTAALVVVLLWAGAQAAVMVETTDVDLGFVYRDEPQKMIFSLVNASADSLHILLIEPSCDCTTAQIVPPVIPPGGQGEAVVFFDPKGYETRGRVTESVRIHTSDRITPEILLTFAIEVGVGPEPEPRSLAFGKVAKGTSDTLAVAVCPGKSAASGQAAPLRLVGTRSDDGRITVAQGGRDATGADQVLVVVTNKAGGGEVSSFVTIRTSDSLKPEIRIPVTANLPGDIAVEPGVIAFGPTLPGAYLQQTVKISSPENVKFKIESVTSSLAQLEFEVSPLGGSSYELRIKVKEGAAAGRIMGDLKIKTDRPGEAPLEVRLAGYVRSGK